jgi:hypothetical protein
MPTGKSRSEKEQGVERGSARPETGNEASTAVSLRSRRGRSPRSEQAVKAGKPGQSDAWNSGRPPARAHQHSSIRLSPRTFRSSFLGELLPPLGLCTLRCVARRRERAGARFADAEESAEFDHGQPVREIRFQPFRSGRRGRTERHPVAGHQGNTRARAGAQQLLAMSQSAPRVSGKEHPLEPTRM